MRLLIVPLVLTALIAAGAHAASTPKNPKSLALRAADMPGGVQPVNEKNGSVVPLPGGGQAKAYLAGWQFRNLARDEQVVITVIATGSASQAQSLFSKLRAEVLKKTKGDAGALPRYGDEQLAATFRDGSTTNAWSTRAPRSQERHRLEPAGRRPPLELEAVLQSSGACGVAEVRGQTAAARGKRLTVSRPQGPVATIDATSIASSHGWSAASCCRRSRR